MNLDKFLELISELDVSFFTLIEGSKRGSVYSSQYYFKYKNSEDLKPEDCIKVEWCSGGTTGASCWGGDSNIPIDGEKEPDFEDLDIILENLCPNITLLQYKKILKIEREFEHGESDYYGNVTNYRGKYYVLQELYNEIKDFIQKPKPKDLL